jgi:hypothetical protein
MNVSKILYISIAVLITFLFSVIIIALSFKFYISNNVKNLDYNFIDGSDVSVAILNKWFNEVKLHQTNDDEKNSNKSQDNISNLNKSRNSIYENSQYKRQSIVTNDKSKRKNSIFNGVKSVFSSRKNNSDESINEDVEEDLEYKKNENSDKNNLLRKNSSFKISNNLLDNSRKLSRQSSIDLSNFNNKSRNSVFDGVKSVFSSKKNNSDESINEDVEEDFKNYEEQRKKDLWRLFINAANQYIKKAENEQYYGMSDLIQRVEKNSSKDTKKDEYKLTANKYRTKDLSIKEDDYMFDAFEMFQNKTGISFIDQFLLKKISEEFFCLEIKNIISDFREINQKEDKQKDKQKDKEEINKLFCKINYRFEIMKFILKVLINDEVKDLVFRNNKIKSLLCLIEKSLQDAKNIIDKNSQNQENNIKFIIDSISDNLNEINDIT